MSNGWTLAYDDFIADPEHEGLREALTTLGNGYFCTRGAAEWANADDIHYPGTYMAGGYNRLVTEVAGRDVVNEDLVNMPNWLCLGFRIEEDEEWFDPRRMEVLQYRHALDCREGVMTRHLVVRDSKGRETELLSRRVVSQARMHLAAIEWTLTPRNWSGPVTVRSALDGRVINWGVARYRDLSSKHLEAMGTESVGEDGMLLVAQTNGSRIQVAQSARTIVLDAAGAPVAVTRQTVRDPDHIHQDLRIEAVQAQPIRIEKLVSFFTSRDRGTYEPATEARAHVARLVSFAEVLRHHRLEWAHLWERADVEIEHHDPEPQLILRLHVFHLLQTASRNTVDLDAGTPARGWHGEAYRGHVFWDELYIFPFLNFRLPEITHSLLLYRYRRLDEARALAREHGYRGAMFPWQSGSNGQEETQTVHLNPKSGRWLPDLSHNQRHVNLAIAFNVWNYFQITGNKGFMSVFGAEMLLEIARFWASIAHYNPDRDRFEIHGVMGPDEFHEQYPGSEEHGLRNNAYTNIMVAWLMDVTLRTLDDLLDYRRAELMETLELTEEEISVWADMAHKMYVPFHDGDIISQFEGYGDLAELDWDAYRAKYGNIHRLDRLLEAEGDSANNYKLGKQPDLLMLFYIFSDQGLREILERLGVTLTEDQIVRIIEYYSARCSHGSTLSNVVHSAINAAHDRAESWSMFLRALESDVRDIQGGTTKEGIHLGAMAGTVDLVQRGFMGIESRDEVLWFNPKLPPELRRVKFNMRHHAMWLDIEADHETLYISPRPGGPNMIRIGVRDKIHFVKSGYRCQFALS